MKSCVLNLHFPFIIEFLNAVAIEGRFDDAEERSGSGVQEADRHATTSACQEGFERGTGIILRFLFK